MPLTTLGRADGIDSSMQRSGVDGKVIEMRFEIRNQDPGFQSCFSFFWQIQRLSAEQKSENTSVCEMIAQLFSSSVPMIRNR